LLDKMPHQLAALKHWVSAKYTLSFCFKTG